MRHAGHAGQYGQDPYVVAHAYLAGITAMQAEPEEARLQLDPRAVGEACACFRRALHTARDQGARSFELRAAEALERYDALRRSETELSTQSRSDAN